MQSSSTIVTELLRSWHSLEPDKQRKAEILLQDLDAVYWMGKRFWIEDRLDLVTGEDLGAGPIMLAEHQKRIVRAALERDERGHFRYSTIVYSAPKKSGKTRVGAGVTAWMAHRGGPYAECYCLANDGKQSADRILSACKKANKLGGLGWKSRATDILLPSGARIEAIPVDPEGEAGSQPLMTTWSELWGYKLAAKEALWSELTIPPTRWGRAIRWAESYAGCVGQAPVLEKLYLEGVENGIVHPDFDGNNGLEPLPVYTNGKLFVYWDEKPRMAWQHQEFYEAEAMVLSESEFLRIHRNQWVDPESAAIPMENWELCKEEGMPHPDEKEPLILAVDASVSGDCTAISIASRHPGDKDRIAIRAVEVWEPAKGKKLDYDKMLRPAIERWCKNHNVVWIAYDEYQLHYLMTQLRTAGGFPHCEQFPQGKGTRIRPGRPIADKQFHDMVISRKLAQCGNPVLRRHVANAVATFGDERYMRFTKGELGHPIDALVASSMAACEAKRLNLG